MAIIALTFKHCVALFVDYKKSFIQLCFFPTCPHNALFTLFRELVEMMAWPVLLVHL